MNKVVVGIDPGSSGGLAFLTHERVITQMIVMPDLPQFFRTLSSQKHEIDHVFLEKAQAMPQQGVSSMFNYGQHFGSLIGVLTACEIPYTLVTPMTWQKILHLGTDSHLDAKGRTLQAAQRLFPSQEFLATERSKKAHMGIVDALMIAEYGVRVRTSFK